MEEPPHLKATYNDVHNIIKATASTIASEFKPDMFIAIGMQPALFLHFNAHLP